MPLLPQKCYELRNVPQLLLLSLFSFWDSHLNLSKSLGVHQLGWFTPSFRCSLKLNTNFNFESTLLFWKHIIGPKQLYIPPLFDETLLVQQSSFFKMFSNCHATMKLLMDCNPCTKNSTTLSNNQFISHRLFRWLKLNELFVAMVMGNIKDERCFQI